MTGRRIQSRVGEILEKRLHQSRFDGPVHEAVLNLLVAAGHVRELVERVSAAHGITSGQYNVLRILKGSYPTGLARCHVAQRLLERAPDVTRLIDRLERQGLVERLRSDADRRLSLTRITRQGLRVIEDMKPEMDRVFGEFSARLSVNEARELSRICERVYCDPRSFEDGS